MNQGRLAMLWPRKTPRVCWVFDTGATSADAGTTARCSVRHVTLRCRAAGGHGENPGISRASRAQSDALGRKSRNNTAVSAFRGWELRKLTNDPLTRGGAREPS
jgi:hypothetical protein